MFGKLTVLFVLAALFDVHTLAAQHSVPDFVGTWELASIEAESATGEWIVAELPMTGAPVGIIMYDAVGNMAVQITGNPRSGENPAEIPEIVNGYIAYYGRYQVGFTQVSWTHLKRHLAFLQNDELGVK